MRVMVVVKATPSSEAGEMPDEQLLREMGDFNEKLVKAGVLLSGDGLHPSSKGVRVRFSGSERSVIDGPFVETKELIAGFWIWRVDSMEEAIEWVKRCPNPSREECEIEIRAILDADDFGDTFTQDLREQEAGVRAQALDLGAPRFQDGRELLITGLNQSYTLETKAEIPTQWERFAPHLGQVPGQVNRVSYGVSWNFRPGHGFDYLSSVEVQETADQSPDFTRLRLAGQRYAVFTHHHHVSSIGETLDKIWKEWAPDSGLELADAPCFERYSEEFNPRSGRGGIEIWIPIRSRKLDK